MVAPAALPLRLDQYLQALLANVAGLAGPRRRERRHRPAWPAVLERAVFDREHPPPAGFVSGTAVAFAMPMTPVPLPERVAGLPASALPVSVNPERTIPGAV